MDQPIRASGQELAGLLRLDGDGPLYRQITDGLKHAIDRGLLPLGTVLPPERALASELAVSRATVVTAYERLKGEGWLDSRRGSGTWVRTPEPHEAQDDATSTSRLFVPARAEAPPPSTVSTVAEDIIDLSAAAVLGTPTVDEILSSLRPADLAEVTVHHGYSPTGLLALRERVAERFTAEGAPTDPEQVVVTTGAQQAIWILARLLLEPEDTVLVESPTFPGALDAFRAVGARLVPLPVDRLGVRVDVLDEMLARLSPKMVYLTPHFHNPTGAVLPLERRRAVAELADRHRIPVVEDRALAEINLDGIVPPPSLAELVPDAPVLTVGSTAKLFWAGLRVGWVRAPRELAARLVATKTVMDLGTSVVSQLLAIRLLERREEIIDERRRELGPRRDLLLELLDHHLPDWTWQRPLGGVSVWAQLPMGNADEFTSLAAEHGVAIVPGTALSVDEGNRRALRVVFARPEDVLEEAVRRLAAAWRAYSPETRPIARLLV